MASRDGDQFINKLPGTGGDFIDGNDVEGHRVPSRAGGATPEPEDEERKRTYPDVEGDVEGHRVPSGDEAEGLYRGGPTTQGEIVMRGPRDNPHGER